MGICNVCGILLILTRTFSMVKICEVKLTINIRDVPYVCDFIRTQCHLWSHDTWSLYCALQCIVCDKVVGSVDLISLKPCKWFFFGFSDIYKMRMRKNLVRNNKAKVDCDVLKAVSLGHFVGIGQGVCHAPWSQTMRSGSKNKMQYSIIGAVDSSIRWALLEIGWPEHPSELIFPIRQLW